MNPTIRTWAEIRTGNLVHNMKAIRATLPANTKFLAVVKADAYGHGAVPAAKALEANGADYLAVACLAEALELRRAGLTLPILILGPTPAACVPELIANQITQTVADAAAAREYEAAAASRGALLRVHIKLDTGMGRLGFRCEGGVAEIAAACRHAHLEPEGVFTHFAMSDVPDGALAAAYTHTQFHLFMDAIAALEREGIRFSLRHCANSGAVLYYPELTALDMVRPGILLYGYGFAGTPPAHPVDVRPCMRLMTRIAAVKTFPAGCRISYGGTYITERETRIGVIPAGYADGLHRCLSNRCEFHTAGGMAPQRGRICMDMCMIDLTELPDAETGSAVEIFGEHASLDKLAAAAGTIPYELLCAVSRRVPRVYIKEMMT